MTTATPSTASTPHGSADAASDALADGLFAHVAPPEEAVRHFRARLSFETDVSDVASGLSRGAPGFALVDTRSDAAWSAGRIPGALHLPGRRILEEGRGRLAPGTPVVVYCWGPGCNGATRAALAFATLGHPVKEMLGGFEYWVREGFDVETDEGRARREVDVLTNVAGTAPAVTCAC
ncbi:rhodanese-like domain-containing protein [Agromyces sp. SYSU T0242]|uniref:rhodanese-like domain-containing protein n=1 Tax=Agromyces litoreus TaxID=3158561 RepID=UPI003391708A